MLEKKLFFKKIFLYKDAEEFSRISGDFNPIHLNNEFASKSIHGRRVVHGMHAFFWALECLYTSANYNRLNSIEVKFKNPIFFKQDVYLEITKKNTNLFNFSIFDENSPKVFFSILAYPCKAVSKSIKSKIFSKTYPNEMDLKSLKTNYYEVDTRFNKGLFKKAFNNLYKKIDHFVLGSLLATSKVIGMKKPGKYSRYISLKAKIIIKERSLLYKVKSFDSRFSLLNLNLKGTLMGEIEAIIPQKPVKVMSVTKINNLIKKNKFNFQSYFKTKKVLIIGGSRGLGAYLVKVLALQGAEVLFSYNYNKKDSLRIIRELKDFKRINIQTCKVNILKNNVNAFKNFQADYVFYMATPQIGKIENKKSIDPKKLNEFYDYYISGFLNVYNLYTFNNKNKVKFFYPSSVLVNKIKFMNSEYLIIKKLGEEICKALNKNKSSNNKILVSKIKPLLTDQHLSFYGSTNLSLPFKNILNLVKEIKTLKT